MKYNDDQLSEVFDRSGGDCHLCGKQLAFKNFASHGDRGAWEVDHSIARARGDGDHLGNLLPACISCNRSKRDGCSRRERRANGLTRSPMSRSKRKQVREDNTVLGVLGGGAIGAALGPAALFVGAAIGGIAGHESRPR